MTRTLQLNFETAAGKKTMLTVDEPRESLTGQEVEKAMQEIIDAGIFEIEASPLTTVVSAWIVERTVTELM